MRTDLLSNLKTLVDAFGPSGRENEISRVIAHMVKPYADEIYTDALGNLIVRKKGPGCKIMLSAHMDSTGVVATFIEDGGFIRFGAVGGVSKNELIGSTVVFENGVKGVVSYEEKVEYKDLTVSDFFIDLGTASKAETEKLVSIGDMAVFAERFFANGDAVASKYLDNRAGCLVLIKTLSEINRPKNDLYFVFSAQEEVGLRGAQTATFALTPDYGIAVDVTDTGDRPGQKGKMAVKMGKGPAIKVMDRSVLCDKKVRDLLENAAKELGIETQQEIMEGGGTDAGAMQKSKAGVLTGAVSIPTRYIHSSCEMLSLSDLGNAVSILACVLSRPIG